MTAHDRNVANRLPITAALMLATLMNTLDSTIANVALPHLQGSLSAAQDQVTWVLTSYIIATALMTPLSGWLSLRIGRKKMLLMSIGGFTAASMLCGMATSLPEIVVFRLLQGVAGASLMPLSQTVMLDLYPPELIPRVMSIWSAAVVLGPIIGPTLGGWLTETLSWRWVFLINLPVGLAAFFGLTSFMADEGGGRQRPFDFIGFAALVAFLGGFQLMLDRGPGQDWLTSPEIWIEAAVSAIGLYLFIVQTVTARQPFFDRDLAKDRNFVTTTLFGMLVGVLLFSTSALLPSFMQNLLGYSSLQSGLASAPRGVGSFVGFLAVPMLMARFGPRRVLLGGVCLSAVSLWIMGQFNTLMTPTLIMQAGLVQGLGMGLLFAPLNTLAYATLDIRHRTEGTIVATMGRSLGSSVGISLLQAVLIRNGAFAHQALSGLVGAPERGLSVPMSLQTPEGLDMINREVTRQGMMISYDAVFSGMALITVIMAPSLLLLRPPRALLRRA